MIKPIFTNDLDAKNPSVLYHLKEFAFQCLPGAHFSNALSTSLHQPTKIILCLREHYS